MKNELKNKKGITLIALVITIIVLLILAGISISMITSQDGILNKAITARDRLNDAADEEAVRLALLSAIDDNGNTDYENIGKYLDGASYENGKIKYKGKTYETSDESISKKGEWYISGNNVTNGTTTIALGATINYDPFTGVDSSKLTATTETEKTGQTAQTFTIANNEAQKLTWKVLGTDDDGNILIMPTTNITDSTGAIQRMPIGGTDATAAQNAAQYAAEEIDRICSIYGYGKGAKSARSVKVEDIDKLTGFDKTTYAQDQGNGYGHDVTYSINETDEYVYYKWSGITEPKKTDYKVFSYLKGSEWVSLTKGQSATIKSTCYFYDMSSDPYKTVLTNKGVYDLIGADNDPYMLSSLCVDAYSEYASFGMRMVYNNSILANFYFNSHDKYSKSIWGLRPAVSLKPDVSFSDAGNGTWNIN